LDIWLDSAQDDKKLRLQKLKIKFGRKTEENAMV